MADAEGAADAEAAWEAEMASGTGPLTMEQAYAGARLDTRQLPHRTSNAAGREGRSALLLATPHPVTPDPDAARRGAARRDVPQL